MKKDFVITYIYHSCFCIEFDDAVFIFDYYKGEIPKFDSKKNIYVFSSHNHYDHFDLNIFELMNIYPNINYILSYDIKLTKKRLEGADIPLSVIDKVISIGKNQSIDINDVHVQTLDSTDRGVAFIVSYAGRVFYHAGDLNWWHKAWETNEYINNMEKSFKTKIEKIKNRYFDIAFLPLDPRIEEGFYLGLDYFMKNTNTNHAIPMHLWDDYNIIKKLKDLEVSESYRDKIIDINYENQILNL